MSILTLETLWDFYLMSWGVRPFDLLAFGAVVILIGVVTIRVGAGHLGTRRDLFLLAGIASLSFIYLFVGVFLDKGNDNVKNGIGFVMGLPFLFAFRQLPLSVDIARRWIAGLILVHCAALLLQEIYYYETGGVLSAVSVIGMETRALANSFRPTGLYQEPAVFALAMSMFVSIRLSMNRRLDMIAAIGLLSILSTFSLWGLVATPLLLAAYLPRSRESLRTLGAAAVIAGGIFAYRYPTDRNLDANVDVVSARVDKVQSRSDSSARARYVPLVDHFMDPDKWEIADLVGSGLSAEYLHYGSNSYGYLLKAGGLCGLVAFTALFSALGSPHGWRVFCLFALFNSAAPLWTIFFWWSWLALLTRPFAPDASGTKAPALAAPQRSRWPSIGHPGVALRYTARRP